MTGLPAPCPHPHSQPPSAWRTQACGLPARREPRHPATPPRSPHQQASDAWILPLAWGGPCLASVYFPSCADAPPSPPRHFPGNLLATEQASVAIEGGASAPPILQQLEGTQASRLPEPPALTPQAPELEGTQVSRLPESFALVLQPQSSPENSGIRAPSPLPPQCFPPKRAQVPSHPPACAGLPKQKENPGDWAPPPTRLYKPQPGLAGSQESWPGAQGGGGCWANTWGLRGCKAIQGLVWADGGGRGDGTGCGWCWDGTEGVTIMPCVHVHLTLPCTGHLGGAWAGAATVMSCVHMHLVFPTPFPTTRHTGGAQAGAVTIMSSVQYAPAVSALVQPPQGAHGCCRQMGFAPGK